MFRSNTTTRRPAPRGGVLGRARARHLRLGCRAGTPDEGDRPAFYESPFGLTRHVALGLRVGLPALHDWVSAESRSGSSDPLIVTGVVAALLLLLLGAAALPLDVALLPMALSCALVRWARRPKA